jgi:chromosome segregation ATPase
VSTEDTTGPSSAKHPSVARLRTTHEELNQRLYEARRDLQAHRARHKLLRTELLAAQNEVAVLRKALSSTSFRLGVLLTKAMRSPKALLRLPADLWRLRTDAQARTKRRKA